ncbi:hypothetical protein [Thermaerobacillus caldiproteolyticus]|uniref:Uncharacterized protein n=1 Tax=Thermaerobacillus caldiproteolyticus TaxID=247480 RepID=A0A7V9Z8A1_9BACL|nr:hypothetical protein [Anoxybacillus caldiproteolyticus]
MLTLIKRSEVYAPSGIAGDKIGYIKDNIDVPKQLVNINVIDADGKLAFSRIY